MSFFHTSCLRTRALGHFLGGSKHWYTTPRAAPCSGSGNLTGSVQWAGASVVYGVSFCVWLIWCPTCVAWSQVLEVINIRLILIGVVHCKFSSLQTGKVRKIFMHRCLFRGGCFWKALCEGVCVQGCMCLCVCAHVCVCVCVIVCCVCACAYVDNMSLNWLGRVASVHRLLYLDKPLPLISTLWHRQGKNTSAHRLFHYQGKTANALRPFLFLCAVVAHPYQALLHVPHCVLFPYIGKEQCL